MSEEQRDLQAAPAAAQQLTVEQRLSQALQEGEPADAHLTPAQMVRRALFPRWEIITPAPFDPRVEENRMLEEILETSDIQLPPEDEHPVH